MTTQQRIDMIYYYENVLENVLSDTHREYAELMIHKLRNDFSDYPLRYEAPKRLSNARPVHCGLNGKTYDSLKEAAKDLSIDRNLASLYLRGVRFNKPQLSYVNKRNQNQFASKKIYCGLNDKTYNSISEATKDLNIHRNTIQGQLKGKITNRLKIKYV
jgi:hypothetical protein